MSCKFKALILVTDKAQLGYLANLYEHLFAKGKKALIFAPEVKIKNNTYITRDLEYYQEIFKISYSQIKQETYKLFYSLADRYVYNGISLRELTNYKGVSLWDLSSPYVFADLMHTLYYINILDKILALEEPSEVYAINNSILADIFSLLCKKWHIAFVVGSFKQSVFPSLKKVFSKYLIFVKRAKRLCVSIYYSVYNFLKSYNLKGKYRVIFFAPAERFFISMLPVILKYKNNERLVINTFSPGSSKRIRENKIPYMDFYGYKLYSLFSWRISKFLKKIKDTIYKNSFLDDVLYKNLPLGLLLANLFEKTIGEHFPDKIREIDIVRKIILTYKPKVVVAADAYLNIILIAKSLSISVVATLSMHPEDFIFYGPVSADAVTVDGNFWKEYLLQHNVEANRIWVVGSPRGDFIHKKNISLKESNLINNFNNKEKIIVFATNYSSLAMGSIRYQNIKRIRNVCNVMKNISEAHLIIKLHPYDNDRNIYKSIVRQAGLTNCNIVKNIDMFGLLYSCDLLITHISAVSYEAVLMDKNVILLCTNSDFCSDDVWDFNRYNAVITVDKLSELESHIRNALFDTETQETLRRNRREYIYEHIYKLDGNASERIKEVIDRFCNNN